MAKNPAEIESKVVPPSDDDLNPHNFSFEEENLDDVILTDSGVWSHSKSLVMGGKQKGKVAPLHGWYEGTKRVQTHFDRENAVKAYVEGCAASGEAPDPAMIETVKKNAPKGLYYVFNLVEPTIVVKGGQPKVQERGKVITHANVLLEQEMEKYTPVVENADGTKTQRLKNIFCVKVLATGKDTTSTGNNLSHFGVRATAFKPLDEYNNEQSMKAFGGAEAAKAMGIGNGSTAKALPAAAAG